MKSIRFKALIASATLLVTTLMPIGSLAATNASLQFNGLSRVTQMARGSKQAAIKPDCVIGSLDFRDDRMTESLYQDAYSQCLHVSVYKILIDQTSSVRDLDFLSNVRVIRDKFDVRRTTKLTSISGLENVESLGGHFYLLDTRNLETTGKAFEKLRKVNAELRITDNRSLQSIDSLRSIEMVDDLMYVIGNPKLVSFERGFSSLRTVYDELRISDNSALADITALTSLESVGSLLQVRGNSPDLDCSFLQEITAGTYSADCF